MTQQSSRRMKRKAQGSGRKIFLSKNVWEAGMERIERIFDEFPEVVVHVSGGKDSTVLLHMALEVAAARRELEGEIAHAKRQAAIEQVHEEARKIKHVTREQVQKKQKISCPECGQPAGNGKFCQSCGASLVAKLKCPGCQTEIEKGARFCPECGHAMAK